MTTASPSRLARTTAKRRSLKPVAPAPQKRAVPAKPAPVNGHGTSKAVFDFSKDPGYYNAEAKKALLRRGKRPPHDELAVDFSRQSVEIRVLASGTALFAGNWDWLATAAGKSLTAAGEWKEVSWHREKSCDYLEIELPLSDGWKLEREMFFARNELFFFVSNCLVGPSEVACEIHFEQMIPLAERANFLAAEETCEGWVMAQGKRGACVVPLSQPEWRSDFRHARFTAGDGQLKLKQAAQGRRLLSSLWIDIHPSRVRRPITWRQLTVGENLAAVHRDVAAGYRIQTGEEQWFVYRSLGPVANRSVMGHNTYGSFVCGRILPDGSVQDILTME